MVFVLGIVIVVWGTYFMFGFGYLGHEESVLELPGPVTCTQSNGPCPKNKGIGASFGLGTLEMRGVIPACCLKRSGTLLQYDTRFCMRLPDWLQRVQDLVDAGHECQFQVEIIEVSRAIH